MIPAHTLFGVLALLTGVAVLLAAKGTPAHRMAGAAYVASMLGLCAGSFWIGEEGRLLGSGARPAEAGARPAAR